MSREHELPSDSDDDDEDYVPEGGDPVSEAESEGDVESSPEDENDENKVSTKKGGNKKLNARNKGKKRSKKRKVVEKEDEESLRIESDPEKPSVTEEEEKVKADLLWADFMKDTGSVSRAKPVKSTNGKKSVSPERKVEEKVKITKVFEFAGEEVKVEKEVAADSAEARLSLPSIEGPAKNDESSLKASLGATSRGRGIKRTGLGGISSVLGQLGKKAKISTLEKSKLDWDSFKREENIDEEINTHNRGKDGYLERQDFLQRADVRQFEIEKQLRLSRRTAR